MYVEVHFFQTEFLFTSFLLRHNQKEPEKNWISLALEMAKNEKIFKSQKQSVKVQKLFEIHILCIRSTIAAHI